MQLTVTTENDNIVSVDVDPGTVVENLKVRRNPPTLCIALSVVVCLPRRSVANPRGLNENGNRPPTPPPPPPKRLLNDLTRTPCYTPSVVSSPSHRIAS